MSKPNFQSLLSLIETHCPSMPRRQQVLLTSKEITEAHRRMMDKVIIFLKSINYQGTVEFDTALMLKEQVSVGLFHHEVVFKVRTVDIYLPDLNIVIEVDGRTHEASTRKMNLDNCREDFLVALGLLPPYRVDNGDVLLNSRASRNCTELLALIKEQETRKLTHPEIFTRAKKNVEENRKAFYKTYPALETLIPSLTTKPKTNVWVKRHFGMSIKLKNKSTSVRGRTPKFDPRMVYLKFREIKERSPTMGINTIAFILGYSGKQLRRIIKVMEDC